MGQSAVYIAVEDPVLEELWALDGQPFRDRFIEIEEDERFERLDIGKIWDALHCTLTGVSASSPIEGDKLSEAIVGVHPKEFDDDDYSVFVSVIDHGEIGPILRSLNDALEADRCASLDLEKLEGQKVYPHRIWESDRSQLIGEMNAELESMCEFFRASLAAGKHILATIL